MKRLILIGLIVILAGTNGFCQKNETKGQDLKLVSLGSLSASNLYLTYLTIGVLADSYIKKVYDNERTIGFVKAVVMQIGVQKQNLQKLLDKNEIPGDDLIIVKKMIDCCDLLVDEGNYFIDYIKTKSKSSLAGFDAKRKEAWALISGIMGIGNTKDE